MYTASGPVEKWPDCMCSRADFVNTPTIMYLTIMSFGVSGSFKDRMHQKGRMQMFWVQGLRIWEFGRGCERYRSETV